MQQLRIETPGIDGPSTASGLADVPSGEDTADRPAFLPRPLRIHDKMFLHNAGIVPRLHAEDETSSEHGAGALKIVCRDCQPVFQDSFVCLASIMEGSAGPPEGD